MKSILTLIIACGFPILLAAQIPNNGFEDWQSKITYNNPVSWSTLNDFTASANIFTCMKGTPGNPGTAYLKLVSKSVNGMGLKPGIAVSGALNTATNQPTSGFPFTGRPESLTGKWQYMASGSDQAFISVLLTHWNDTTQSRDTIGFKYLPLPGMAMSWANFTIPLTYQTDAFPDSAIIVLSASNANGKPTAANSYLYIDALDFKNTIYLSAPMITDNSFSMFPNPASTKLNIELSGEYNEVAIAVYDLTGVNRFIATNNKLLSGKTVIDINKLPAGTYLLKLRIQNKILSRTFIKI